VCPQSNFSINPDVPGNDPFVFQFHDVHQPVSYFCALDANGFFNCTQPNPDTNSLDRTVGVFAWELFGANAPDPIADGNHTVEYFARDRFGNPSIHKTWTFVVDRQAPTVTITDIQGSAGTSGSFNSAVIDNRQRVTGGAGTSSGTIVDNSPIALRHAIANVRCFIDGVEVTGPTEGCGFVPNEGDPSMGTFSFDFSGLKDENTGGKNPHDVLVTASDA